MLGTYGTWACPGCGCGMQLSQAMPWSDLCLLDTRRSAGRPPGWGRCVPRGSALQSPPAELGQDFSSTLVVLGGLLSLVYLFPARSFPGDPFRVCLEPSSALWTKSFPRGAAPEGSCSPPGLCLGVQRSEEMRWVMVGAPSHPLGRARSPPCRPS